MDRIPGKVVVLLISLALLVAFLLGRGGAGATTRAEAAPLPAPAACSPEEQFAWMRYGLDVCEAKCGPVPFDAEISPSRLRCVCGRPPNVGVVRPPKRAMPLPPSAPAPVEEGPTP